MKKLVVFFAIVMLVFSFNHQIVHGDTQTIYVLGQDLTPTQKKVVLNQLGYKSGEKIITVSTKEIEEVSSGVLKEDGKKALSSIKIQLNSNGLDVTTKNINLITPRMYKQVLLTAGITNAIVNVTAPAPVSGTSAVVGIMKGYEAVTNKSIGLPLKKVVFKEIALTTKLNSLIGEEKTFNVLKEIKTKMSEQPSLSNEQIQQLVTEVMKNTNVPAPNVKEVEQLYTEMKGASVNWNVVKEELKSEKKETVVPFVQPTPKVEVVKPKPEAKDTSSMLRWYVLGGIFLFFIFLYSLIGIILLRIRRNPMKRIEKYTENIKVKAEKIEKPQSKLATMKAWLIPKVQHFRRVKKLEKALNEANLSIKPEEFFIVQWLVVIFSFFLMYMTNASWAIMFIVLISLYLLPTMFVKVKRNRRMKKVPRQLLQALGILSNSIRAGYSFNQALQSVANELGDPLGTEFKTTVQDMLYNPKLEEVFAELLERLPSKELEIVLDAVVIQQTSGGNIGQLLDTVEDVIRERIRLQEEVTAITAQGRYSSWVITLLPIGLGLYFNFANPDYFSPLLETTIGKVMLAVMAFMIFLGWVTIRKLIKIEV